MQGKFYGYGSNISPKVDTASGYLTLGLASGAVILGAPVVAVGIAGLLIAGKRWAVRDEAKWQENKKISKAPTEKVTPTPKPKNNLSPAEQELADTFLRGMSL